MKYFSIYRIYQSIFPYILLLLSFYRSEVLSVIVNTTEIQTFPSSFRLNRNNLLGSQPRIFLRETALKKTVDLIFINSTSTTPTVNPTSSSFSPSSVSSQRPFTILFPIPSISPTRSPRLTSSAKPSKYRTASPSRKPSNIRSSLPSTIPSIFPTETSTNISYHPSAAPSYLNLTQTLITAQFQTTIILNNCTFTELDLISIMALVNTTAMSIGVPSCSIVYLSDAILAYRNNSRVGVHLYYYYSIAAKLTIINPVVSRTITESNDSTQELIRAIHTSLRTGIFSETLSGAILSFRAGNLSGVSIERTAIFSSIQFSPVGKPNPTPTISPTIQTSTSVTTSNSPTTTTSIGDENSSNISTTNILDWPVWMSVTVLAAACLTCVLVTALFSLKFCRKTNSKVHVYSSTESDNEENDDEANKNGIPHTLIHIHTYIHTWMHIL